MIHRKQFKTKNTDKSYWKSYSDMMAALLLMFILIMILSLSIATEKTRQYEELVSEYSGMKKEITERLKEEFWESPEIIDENGNVHLDSSKLLFEEGKSDLSDSCKAYLDDFIPRYFNVVLTKDWEPYIEAIIIEGHTNSNGTYVENLKLSQDRALAVANYCIKDGSTVVKPQELEKMRKLITANGRSFSDKIEVNGVEDKTKSRRVEIRIDFSDKKREEEFANIK